MLIKIEIDHRKDLHTMDVQRSFQYDYMVGDNNIMDILPGLKGTFSTILIDPPWRFQNRTGKMAPEHKRLHRYRTMTVDEIASLPIASHAEVDPVVQTTIHDQR